MLLRLATAADIPQIAALERLPESRKYVGQWSETRHLAALSGGDARYYAGTDESGAIVAYVILRGLADSETAIELTRIVVAAPGRGLGRQILTEIQRIVFEELGRHRLFLDVQENNPRARHLYESVGFVLEGTMRDAAVVDGNYYALHLMSLLEDEYRARKSAANASAL